MFLINTAMERISIGTAGLIVVLGMAVVFFGLILLMYVTKIAGAILMRRKQAQPESAAAAAPAAPAPKVSSDDVADERLRPRPARPARSSCMTCLTRRPPCSWPSSPTRPASPSTSCASSPSARSSERQVHLTSAYPHPFRGRAQDCARPHFLHGCLCRRCHKTAPAKDCAEYIYTGFSVC